MINYLSIAFHAFASRMLTSVSVDEMLLPKYLNWGLRGLQLKVEMGPSCLKHELCWTRLIQKTYILKKREFLEMLLAW